MANTINNQRNAFSDWMRRQQKSTGEQYSLSTVNQYCNPLAHAVPKLSLTTEVKPNLFEYTSANDFENVIKIIRNAPNFSEIDRKSGNGAFAAAMPLYLRFLQEESSVPGTAVAQSNEDDMFQWISFYEALADILLTYKDKRHELYEIIDRLVNEQPLMGYLHFHDHPEWWPTQEIDPFTILAIFNRGNLTISNRVNLAKALGDTFGVAVTVPTKFEGIPVLNAQNAFFNNEGMDELWNLCISAIGYADGNITASDFKDAFDAAASLKNNKWKITLALFWVRPNVFMPLDVNSRQYLQSNFGIDVKQTGGCCSADEYISVLEQINEKLEGNGPVHSFAELSFAAWNSKGTPTMQPAVSSPSNPAPRSNAHYWVYAPGERAANWPRDLKLGEMSIGWDELGDLSQYNSRDKVIAALESFDVPNSKAKSQSGVVWNFFGTLNVGDVIYARRGRREIIGRGIVQGNYEFDESRGEDFSYRSVQWTHNGSWDYPGGMTAMHPLQDITERTDVISQLESAIVVADSSDKTYTKADFLSEVYLSDEQYDTLCGLLARKKNIILQGAPGVGKTFAAKRLAYSIMGEKDDSRIRTVQFHQSYSYEDFVLGYRPNENGFSLETGLFYDFCKTASADPDRDYYFIVDEINRGNLSKIFGELLMLIESDKRGPLYAVQLAYHSDELDRRFYVPDNLYIIGMMNTADRSLATIDYALRRRFAFFTMLPKFKGIPSQSPALMKVIAEVEVINAELTKELGSGFQIGHSYFIGKDNASVSDSQLRPIVEFELIPLLQEYYFDDESRLNDAVLKLRNALQ